MQKIIVNTPNINSPAGVSNHFLGLRDYFSDRVIYNEYRTSAYIERLGLKTKMVVVCLRMIFMLRDLTKFIFLIARHSCPIIMLNPSFGENALKRDSVFLQLAKKLGCKVAVMFHGWNLDYLQAVLEGKKKIAKVWKSADLYFVLGKEFADYLQRLGVVAPIHITTTKVSDKLIEGLQWRERKHAKTILFLARVTREKGVYIALDAYKQVKAEYPDAKLKIVGSGNEINNVRQYINEKQIDDVEITGALSGQELRNAFYWADIYMLPTYHGEGMPTSVLEAMAFGLPVITRPVGGLVDIFEDGKMGFMIESLESNDFAQHLKILFEDVQRLNKISRYNWDVARKRFLASKVAAEIESVLNSL